MSNSVSPSSPVSNLQASKEAEKGKKSSPSPSFETENPTAAKTHRAVIDLVSSDSLLERKESSKDSKREIVVAKRNLGAPSSTDPFSFFPPSVFETSPENNEPMSPISSRPPIASSSSSILQEARIAPQKEREALTTQMDADNLGSLNKLPSSPGSEPMEDRVSREISREKAQLKKLEELEKTKDSFQEHPHYKEGIPDAQKQVLQGKRILVEDHRKLRYSQELLAKVERELAESEEQLPKIQKEIGEIEERLAKVKNEIGEIEKKLPSSTGPKKIEPSSLLVSLEKEKKELEKILQEKRMGKILVELKLEGLGRQKSELGKQIPEQEKEIRINHELIDDLDKKIKDFFSQVEKRNQDLKEEILQCKARIQMLEKLAKKG